MSIFRRYGFRIVSVLALCGAWGVHAHDLFIMPDSFRPERGARITIGFHVSDSFPDSEVGGRLERLRNPRLVWAGGGTDIVHLRTAGKRNVGDAVVRGSGHVIAVVSTTPTVIELEPGKFTEYLKHEGLTETLQWRANHGESGKPGRERYSKYAKALLVVGAGDGFARHAVGHIIEIIPEADPYRLKPGDSLPIRVLFQGKPAEDLQVQTAWAAKGKSQMAIAGRTGREGRLRVPLHAAGLWRIHTIKMQRCAEPATADWESFWASVTFELR